MKCKICPHEAPHPRAISNHWKLDHPVEFKKRQREQKAKKAALAAPPPVEEAAPDAEVETMLALVATIEAADVETGDAVHDYEARSRILLYVADRVGVKLIASPVAEAA